MRLSIGRVSGLGFTVVDEVGDMEGRLFSGPLGDCLDYIERRFIENERDQRWADAAPVRSAPRDLFAFAKSGQLAPVTESNP